MFSPNLGLFIGRQGQVIGSEAWDLIFCGNTVEDYNLYRRGNNACFPLFLYSNEQETLHVDAWPHGPGGRTLNLKPEFVQDFADRVHLSFLPYGRGDLQTTCGAEDILRYTYAVLHAPMYRARYAEFLKRDFPRVPLTSNLSLFRELCSRGEELVGLHLMERSGPPMAPFGLAGSDEVEKVRYAEPKKPQGTGQVWINRGQHFDGVPPPVWEFHIGGYRVCEKWLKDRTGRKLSHDDIRHYQQIVSALSETLRLMAEIDDVIAAHGGWPIK
jgi:predicted helicase